MKETLPRSLDEQRDWEVCPACRSLVYAKRLTRNLGVCPECGAHHRLSADDRIGQLLDKGSIEVIDWPVDWLGDADPLNFVDTKPYRDRLAAARRSTGLADAVVLVKGTVRDNPVVAAVMDFSFLGGSLGTAVGAADRPGGRDRPRRGYPAAARYRLRRGEDAGGRAVPHADGQDQPGPGQTGRARACSPSRVITDPTYGGVAASFATLCDVIIAEPGSRHGIRRARG